MIDIFKIGNKRPIEEHELYELKDGLHSSKITDRFHILWEEEKKKKSPSLLRAMYNVYGLQLIYWGLSFCLFETVLRYDKQNNININISEYFLFLIDFCFCYV